MIDAVDHRRAPRSAFYDLFIDRARWPGLMREGYENATRVLDELRAKSPSRPRDRTSARNGGRT